MALKPLIAFAEFWARYNAQKLGTLGLWSAWTVECTIYGLNMDSTRYMDHTN